MGSRGGASGKSSGKSSGGGARKTDYQDVQFDEPEIEAGKPTKYSREIFKDNYREARKYANDTEGEFSFAGLYSNNSQRYMTAPALKGVQALINTEKRAIKTDVDFGIITPEKATNNMRALSAVQKTLNKTVVSQREYDTRLKKKK